MHYGSLFPPVIPCTDRNSCKNSILTGEEELLLIEQLFLLGCPPGIMRGTRERTVDQPTKPKHYNNSHYPYFGHLNLLTPVFLQPRIKNVPPATATPLQLVIVIFCTTATCPSNPDRRLCHCWCRQLWLCPCAQVGQNAENGSHHRAGGRCEQRLFLRQRLSRIVVHATG